MAAEKSSHGNALQNQRDCWDKKKPHPAYEQASRSFVNQVRPVLRFLYCLFPESSAVQAPSRWFSPSGIRANRLLPGN